MRENGGVAGLRGADSAALKSSALYADAKPRQHFQKLSPGSIAYRS
jgi:hypothetical protein